MMYYTAITNRYNKAVTLWGEVRWYEVRRGEARWSEASEPDNGQQHVQIILEYAAK